MIKRDEHGEGHALVRFYETVLQAKNLVVELFEETVSTQALQNVVDGRFPDSPQQEQATKRRKPRSAPSEDGESELGNDDLSE
jgi:hypothetical protein